MTAKSPFLLVVFLVEGVGSGKMGGARGRERKKEGRQGGSSSLAGQTRERLPRETAAEGPGGREMSTLGISLRSCNARTEIATVVVLASYESSQHCVGVGTCLWKQAFHLGKL